MAKTAYALKIHSYTTGAGHDPATGAASADFRGDKWVGHMQGDEHHCLFALKSLDSLVVEELLVVLPGLNAAILAGEGHALGNLHLPDSIGGAMAALGGIPNLRFGIWDNDR